MENVKTVSNPKIESRSLEKPSVDQLIAALRAGLKSNFESVQVQLVECPDLTQAPFHLAAKGLGGNPCLVDLGGVPYLVPTPQRDKAYDLKELPHQVNMGTDSLVIGAGAGPWFHVGTNCEMMTNMAFRGSDKDVTMLTRVATYRVGAREQKTLPRDETRCALLANLLVCEGRPGPVLEVRCSRRTGEANFVSCMRNALKDQFKDQPVGLGGVFLIEEGKAKLHIMPDFSPCPLNSDADVENWLHFYEASAPLICLSVFVSSDPGLDLRVEHTHCFSVHGEGGHYHEDVTPDQVTYRGYFAVAERIVRIDRPDITHQIGRD